MSSENLWYAGWVFDSLRGVWEDRKTLMGEKICLDESKAVTPMPNSEFSSYVAHSENVNKGQFQKLIVRRHKAIERFLRAELEN